MSEVLSARRVEWAPIHGRRSRTNYCPFPLATVPARIAAHRLDAPPLVLQSDFDPTTPFVLGPMTAGATGGVLGPIHGTMRCHFDAGNHAVDDVVHRYLRTGEVDKGLSLPQLRPQPGPQPWTS